MAFVSSFLIYVLRKTAFQAVYTRLLALVCSILNVMDTVRTVKVLYSTSASVYKMCIYIHWRTSRCIYCIGGWFKFAGRLFVCVRVCSELVSLQSRVEYKTFTVLTVSITFKIEQARARRRVYTAWNAVFRKTQMRKE
jgi:hypothetical protein